MTNITIETSDGKTWGVGLPIDISMENAEMWVQKCELLLRSIIIYDTDREFFEANEEEIAVGLHCTLDEIEEKLRGNSS